MEEKRRYFFEGRFVVVFVPASRASIFQPDRAERQALDHLKRFRDADDGYGWPGILQPAVDVDWLNEDQCWLVQFKTDRAIQYSAIH